MCRRQGEIQVLLPIFYTGNSRLLYRVRQDDQLIEVIPQTLKEHIVFPHLRGDRPVRIKIRENRRDLPQRGRCAGTQQDRTLAAVEGLDTADHVLALLHEPFGDYYGAWRAMERLYHEGAVRAIGVSNFTPERLVDLCMNQEIKPMVNQIEIHPFFQQNTTLRVMEDYGVLPQAWGPFSEAQKDIFNHKMLAKIAGRHSKTTAQVILRWHIQRNIPTVPKTVHKERMIENLDVFDFELSEKEMESITSMDIGHSEIIDHHSFCTARQLNSVKIHG